MEDFEEIRKGKREGLSNEQIRKALSKHHGKHRAEELFTSYYKSKVITFSILLGIISLATIGFFSGGPVIIGNVVLAEGTYVSPVLFFTLLSLLFIAAFTLGIVSSRVYKKK